MQSKENPKTNLVGLYIDFYKLKLFLVKDDDTMEGSNDVWPAKARSISRPLLLLLFF